MPLEVFTIMRNINLHLIYLLTYSVEQYRSRYRKLYTGKYNKNSSGDEIANVNFWGRQRTCKRTAPTPVLYGGADRRMWGVIFREKDMPGHARWESAKKWKKWSGQRSVRYTENTIERSMFGGPAKTAEPIEMPFGFWTRVRPRNHVLDGVQIAPYQGLILWERTWWGMPEDTLTWTAQKRLHRSRCRLGYGLGWAQGSMN